MKKNIFKSLAFRVVAPVMAVTAIIGIIVYLFLLRNISDFAEGQIRSSLAEMGNDVYEIFDRTVNELSSKGLLNNERAVRIEKARAIAKIEEFLKSSNLGGFIIEDGKERLNTGGLSHDLPDIIEKTMKEQRLSRIHFGDRVYYVYHTYFELWNWHVILLKGAADFSSLIRKVRLLYIITGCILLLSALFLMVYLRKTLQELTRKIIDSLKNRETIEYKGIEEFENLSRQINIIREDLERETEHLNYIYYISATKKGEAFFEEVVRTINHLFGLNSLIARIDEGGSQGHVIAMYIDGEVKKGFDLPLIGTPCQDVMEKGHLVVIEKDVSNLYPNARVLKETGAVSYIGFAIFNRKGEPLGILNAFGRETEFSESDIKVLQTLGQIVASEIERIEEEKEKERIREHLLQAQKMEAIGTLAGGIAHDFNNMLQGILGYASLLKLKISETDPIYRPLDVIERTAERAAELTRQLLGYARKGKFLVETLNLNNLVGEVMKIITRTFDRAIEIKTRLSDDIWSIEGDKSQIENVILNLCVNARDAMPTGGILTIETYNKEVLEGEFPFSWAIPGRYAVIKVTDTGTGMDEEVKKHIFEPFFTTKGIGKGTGMGLAMVYGVVKNHNGFITVDSEPGKGSIFTIYLPASETKTEEKMEEIRTPVTGTGTILIIDDEEAIRNLLSDSLSGLGYNTIEASNGREAINFYLSNKDKIDLVILDLIMPVMGGEETLIRLKEINPNVKLLIAIGYGVSETLKDVLRDKGINGFINKPFNIAEISEMIKTVLST
ncbi:MAG: ATP-binding protein [Thermodesulfovibrionales bacterium]